MPKPLPLPNWSKQDAFIIGGGPSLDNFAWRNLHSKNTIGCNHAFLLGAEVCKVCIFGDWSFWEAAYEKRTPKLDITTFDGYVVTNYMLPVKPSWVTFFERVDFGLFNDGRLGWNTNTGACAVNLALLMGAQRVFLLGFDMNKAPDGKTHWHNQPLAEQNGDHYRKFMESFDTIACDLSRVFPGREIINVTDGSSALKCFPTKCLKEVLL